MDNNTPNPAAVLFVELLTGRAMPRPDEVEYIRCRLRQQGLTTRQVNARVKKLLSGFSDREAIDLLEGVQDCFFDVRS